MKQHEKIEDQKVQYLVKMYELRKQKEATINGLIDLNAELEAQKKRSDYRCISKRRQRLYRGELSGRIIRIQTSIRYLMHPRYFHNRFRYRY